MIEDNLLHPKKAEFPILVTELGIVIDFNELQPRKANLSIAVIPLGIVTCPSEGIALLGHFISIPSLIITPSGTLVSSSLGLTFTAMLTVSLLSLSSNSTVVLPLLLPTISIAFPEREAVAIWLFWLLTLYLPLPEVILIRYCPPTISSAVLEVTTRLGCALVTVTSIVFCCLVALSFTITVAFPAPLAIIPITPAFTSLAKTTLSLLLFTI